MKCESYNPVICSTEFRIGMRVPALEEAKVLVEGGG